jgi:hypothetical protein
MANICFITAIYGNYEISCKKNVKQTIDTDLYVLQIMIV